MAGPRMSYSLDDIGGSPRPSQNDSGSSAYSEQESGSGVDFFSEWETVSESGFSALDDDGKVPAVIENDFELPKGSFPGPTFQNVGVYMGEQFERESASNDQYEEQLHEFGGRLPDQFAEQSRVQFEDEKRVYEYEYEPASDEMEGIEYTSFAMTTSTETVRPDFVSSFPDDTMAEVNFHSSPQPPEVFSGALGVVSNTSSSSPYPSRKYSSSLNEDRVFAQSPTGIQRRATLDEVSTTHSWYLSRPQTPDIDPMAESQFLPSHEPSQLQWMSEPMTPSDGNYSSSIDRGLPHSPFIQSEAQQSFPASPASSFQSTPGPSPRVRNSEPAPSTAKYYQCPKCPAKIKLKKDFRRHDREVHGEPNFPCRHCGQKGYRRKYRTEQHEKLCSGRLGFQIYDPHEEEFP